MTPKPTVHITAQLSKGGTKVVFRKWGFDIYQLQFDTSLMIETLEYRYVCTKLVDSR